MFSKKNLAIVLFTNLIFWLLLFTNIRWLRYAAHLVNHQWMIFSQRVAVDKIINQKPADLSDQQYQKLKLVAKAKEFGRKIYSLPNSVSFEQFVNLKRKTLGFNITMTDTFSLSADLFKFPFIGSFGYLGFFDPDILTDFVKYYQSQNKDVYISEFSAYSTLGILPDPLFSTYLYQDDIWLIEIILHELAHEKLWIPSDTEFNEKLATFISLEATKRFAKENKLPLQELKNLRPQVNSVFAMVENTKLKLEKLFIQNLPFDVKHKKKREIYTAFFENVSQDQYKFSDKRYHGYILRKRQEINNAWLIQFRRYSGAAGRNNFSEIFAKICHKNFDCFFREISYLKACTANQRIDIIEKRQSLPPSLQKICSTE